MNAIGNRQATTVLYTDAQSISCHCVRLALAEKNIKVETIYVPDSASEAELIGVNPQGEMPTLIDRDLTLYNDRVIIDYLDERYPHPPLMPVDPISRAKTRQAMYRIHSDWYPLMADPSASSKSEDGSLTSLQASLTAANELFALKPFFFSEEYSILDVILTPLLWRLGAYQIELPDAEASAIRQYANRMFAREGFQASLSEAERNMPQ